MNKRVKIMMILALIALVSCASAQLVSFADPDSTAHKDVYLYNSSGMLLGSYNTTSTAINITDAGDVMFVLKPQYSNPLDDPATFADNLWSWLRTNLFYIIVGGAVTVMLVKRF